MADAMKLLPDIEAEGERIVRDTYKREGDFGYLWTDVVGAVQTAISEERARWLAASPPAREEAPELALEDAKAFGIGFIVDGQRVSPDRVTVCRGEEAPAEGAVADLVCSILEDEGGSGAPWSVIAERIAATIVDSGHLAVEALGQIAKDQQYRSGYCQTDITVEPALSADEAQALARDTLTALRKRTSEPEAGAVAWLHTLHLELEQTFSRLTENPQHPFGKPGEDYSEGYRVSTTPMFTHPAPATATADKLRELIEAAYIAGATNVHEYWCDNPGEAPAPRNDPEFDEAASDYALAALNEQPQ